MKYFLTKIQEKTRSRIRNRSKTLFHSWSYLKSPLLTLIRSLISPHYQNDCLPSPLFKKSWQESPFKPVTPEIGLTGLKEETHNLHHPKENESGHQTNDQRIWEPVLFKGGLITNIPELLPEHLVANNHFVAIYNAPESHTRIISSKTFSNQFNLERDAQRIISESADHSEIEKRKFLSIISSRNRRISEFDRSESVRRYIEKRKRRKYVCQIKYKVRQDLACQRLRVKGKFVKSSKMNLMTAANMLLDRLVNRRTSGGEK
jgi:hypothetical protein